MDSITITRPVTVKVVMTEAYRTQLLAQCERTKAGLDAELQRLEFELKKALAETRPGQEQTIRHQFEMERHKRFESKRKLTEQMQAAREITGGTELVAGRIESMVDVHVGDDWGKLAMVEVLVKDGKVIAITEGTPGVGEPV